MAGATWSNWSGGVRCKPMQIVTPKDEVELAATIRNADTVRAPGSGHSFTPVAASDGTLIKLSAFSGFRRASAQEGTATFAAATPLWAVGPVLHAHGLALKNMGDIDRQTLAGVVSTGTHGTGATLRNFSAEVAGFRIVLANGDVLNCDRSQNPEIFAAGRCSLGMLGVMTEITMHARPVYRLHETNFLMGTDELFGKLDQLITRNRHFEFFWFPYADRAVCKALNETQEAAPEPRSAEEMRKRGENSSSDEVAFSAINEVLPYAPFLLKPAHRLFSQLMPGTGKVRWSHEAFPSPRTVRFNEMEYAVPREKGPDCLKEIVAAIRSRKISTGFPIEYRTVAADDVWLSPFYQRDSATIAVHQYHRVDTTRLFETCEAIFARYEGRPHWGKRHTRNAQQLESLYPKYGAFRALRRYSDPRGKFLNEHLRAIFE